MRQSSLYLFSLRRQVIAINTLSSAGMYFWDYGNAFLLEASRAGTDIQYIKRQLFILLNTLGAAILKPGGGPQDFLYPSYVQHIMG